MNRPTVKLTPNTFAVTLSPKAVRALPFELRRQLDSLALLRATRGSRHLTTWIIAERHYDLIADALAALPDDE
jgi:hypothetical protein